LQLVNHGLSSAGLFALVGMIYERYHTRNIASLGGIASKAPWLAALFMLFTFSSIGLPGLNGFVGEFMILAGSFQRAWGGVSAAWRTAYLVMACLGVAGVVLGAWYMLWAVERVLFGASREPPKGGAAHGSGGHDHGSHDHGAHGHAAHAAATDDLAWHELAALLPLAVFVFWIGLVPATFLGPTAGAVRGIMQPSAQAFAARMEEANVPAAAAADLVSLPHPSPSR
jgi:NADH-quinone oxidoreductase subunit M